VPTNRLERVARNQFDAERSLTVAGQWDEGVSRRCNVGLDDANVWLKSYP